MRRTRWVVLALLLILGGVAIGVGAYHAGVNHGLVQAGHASQIVRVVGPGYGFPFGFLLFPVFFFLILFGIRGAFWGRKWREGHPHAEWGSEGRWRGRDQAFEDWHRRQHAGGSGDRGDPGGSGPGEPASV